MSDEELFDKLDQAVADGELSGYWAGEHQSAMRRITDLEQHLIYANARIRGLITSNDRLRAMKGESK